MEFKIGDRVKWWFEDEPEMSGIGTVEDVDDTFGLFDYYVKDDETGDRWFLSSYELEPLEESLGSGTITAENEPAWNNTNNREAA